VEPVQIVTIGFVPFVLTTFVFVMSYSGGDDRKASHCSLQLETCENERYRIFWNGLVRLQRRAHAGKIMCAYIHIKSMRIVVCVGSLQLGLFFSHPCRYFDLNVVCSTKIHHVWTFFAG
jgi:hypothetical protein